MGALVPLLTAEPMRYNIIAYILILSLGSFFPRVTQSKAEIQKPCLLGPFASGPGFSVCVYIYIICIIVV